MPNKEVFGEFQRSRPLLTAAPKSKGQSALPKGFGTDLMRQISDGTIQKASATEIEKVRTAITDNCEEILDFGARIRPLVAGGQQIGWVRGVHNSERKLINRLLVNSEERILHNLLLATTFSKDEVEAMSAGEIRNLAQLVKQMSDSDITLFPYLSAFVTTMSSENLWHGRGRSLSSFENRHIEMPDGRSIKILIPADHARLWATLCTYREQAKVRLDNNWNALMMVRPLAGRSADPVSNDLRAAEKRLRTNAVEPWEQVVRPLEKTEIDDGWAHAGDSPEDLMRELSGMLAHDRHERVIAAFEKQQVDDAETERQRLQKIIDDRGGPGITEETVVIQTEAEVRQREQELRRGKPPVVDRAEREVFNIGQEKIRRYK